MVAATFRPPRAGEPLRPDLARLAAITIALRIPAFLAERHLSFDDGVYGASAAAMRAGARPYREVFSSQGPLFLPLIWIADALGLRTTNAPRLISLVASLLLVGSTYMAGRIITDRTGALMAAAIVSASASILWVSGPITSDGSALAFATLTVMLALRWRDQLSTRRAVWLGLGVGATISVKALLAPVVVPVALVLLAERRVRTVIAGAAATVAFHLLLWLPWGPGKVWEQSYEYHLDAAGDPTPGRNLLKVLSTLGDRDMLAVAALALAAGAVALRTRADRGPGNTGSHFGPADALLGAWLAATFTVLLFEHPLWRPHVSALIPALALLAARHRPPARVLAAAAVVVLPYHVVHSWPMLRPAPYTGSAARVVPLLEALPPGALAISDDPGIVWRAGRRTTPDLVDTSILRMETGQLTASSVGAVASQREVCAVVVRSVDRWGSFADLPDRLADAGYDVADDDGRRIRLYLKRVCDPG